MNVSEIIELVDPVEYIGQYIELEQKGDEWWGLSCFKDENTPSFSIRPETGLWYDFSSGRGGNIIDFIKLHDHCNTRIAVEKIKAFLGITGEIERMAPRLLSTSIAKQFRPSQRKQKEATYKILRDNYMDMFEQPGSHADIWRAEGITDASMEKFGVRYDRFQNRLCYPIRSMDGKIINVNGRSLDENLKEKGIRKYSYYYNLGILDTIYGFFENKTGVLQKREIILFEGAKSVMIADSWGIDNAGAVMTSHLNPHQLKLLIKLGVRVVLAFDEDVDVRQDKNVQTLRHYVNVEWVYPKRDKLLGNKMAPVDAGKEVWESLYHRRISL